MGYDLPAAIGIWAASRKDGAYSMGAAREGEDVILVTGDGSIQMNLQELQTIIHHHMGIKIFLINNGGYHSIRQITGPSVASVFSTAAPSSLL